MRKRFAAIALVAALLGAGVVIGVVVERAWLAEAADSDDRAQRGRDGRTKRFERRFERFRERLDLDDKQAEAIRQIMRGARDRSWTIRDEVRPRLRSIREAAQGEIRSLLSEEQRREYAEILQERRQRHRRRGRRHRGPPK